MRTALARRLSLGAAGAVALVMLGAAVAWACTPGVPVPKLCGSATAEAGGSILICGSEFNNQQPVAVRWETADGPVLRTATGPSFKVPVSIPASATPGEHTIVLTFTSEDQPRQLSQGFRVVAPGEDERPAPGVTSRSSSGAEPGAVTGSTTEPATEPATSETAVATPAADAESSSVAAQIPAAQIPAALRTLPVSSNPGAVRAPSGRVVFGGSVAPSATPSAQPATAEGNAPAVAPRAAVTDLWSGFASGTTPRQGLGGGAPASNSAGSSPLAVGLAILGFGMVALFGGFGVAELQRRRSAIAQRAHG